MADGRRHQDLVGLEEKVGLYSKTVDHFYNMVRQRMTLVTNRELKESLGVIL